MPRLLVALPAYNEEACLPPLLRSFAELFAQHPDMRDPLIIVVDDGSKDGTSRVTEEAAKTIPVRLVQHEQNRGLGPAIKTGLWSALDVAQSDDDVLICMDADDTHPPSHVPSMLAEIAKGADIVIASRYRKGSEQHGVPFNRLVMSWGARWLFAAFLRLEGVRDYTCGFRAYRMGLVRKALETYGDEIITRDGFACTDQLLVNMACLGAKITEVPFILRYDKKVGPSKIKLGLTIKETMALLVDGRKKLRASGR